MSDQIIHQAIHPDIRGRLDPEYVAFHDKTLQYVLPSHLSPWDESQQTASSPFARTLLQNVDVGNIEDVSLKHSQLRIFTPRGEAPEKGWPVLMWFHGGGWVLGSLDSDNALCSHIAAGASCVTINVNYRHAPKDPYPAAVEDVLEALQWIASSQSSKVHVDPSRIAIGGSSAGGNLAAILSLKASLCTPPIPLLAQILLLPVIDNTATASSAIWSENKLAPWLTPDRMLWYRDMYLPNKQDRLGWAASPNLASKELLSKSPRTWIAVAECDLLAPEALAYARQLREAKVDVDMKRYKGSTHSLLVASGTWSHFAPLGMNADCLGLLSMGKQLVAETISVIKEIFESTD